jgi:hypothetical protein
MLLKELVGTEAGAALLREAAPLRGVSVGRELMIVS